MQPPSAEIGRKPLIWIKGGCEPDHTALVGADAGACLDRVDRSRHLMAHFPHGR